MILYAITIDPQQPISMELSEEIAQGRRSGRRGDSGGAAAACRILTKPVDIRGPPSLAQDVKNGAPIWFGYKCSFHGILERVEGWQSG